MSHLIQLIVGDWSGDGHRETEDLIITSSLSRNEVNEAHQAGCALVGVDFDRVCEHYEDGLLPDQDLKKLVEHGILTQADNPREYSGGTYFKISGHPDHEGVDDDDYYDGGAPLYPEAFALIWMEIAKLGNPDLVYSIHRLPTIHVGGYGLFC